MGYAGDLTRLAEEIASAYEERVNSISAIKQETTDLIGAFGEAHNEMTGVLRADLSKFKSDLDAAEGERKKADQGEIAERRDYIGNLIEKARELVNEFNKAHGEMADNLQSDLSKFKSDLDAEESDRKAADQAEIRERKWAISSMLDDFRKKHEGAATAWGEIEANMQPVRGQVTITGPVKAEAAVEVKPVEEAIEEPVEEAEEEEPEEEMAEEAGIEEKEAIEEGAAEEEIEEDLGGRILDLLEDNPDGLRMVEIADIMGIENWRTLIPVMRELLDEDEIRKEGSTYYLA